MIGSSSVSHEYVIDGSDGGRTTGFRMVTDESDALGTKVIYGPIASIVAVEEAAD